MGDESGQIQTRADQARPLVAFDFDGTLTVSDSFTGFLRWRAGEMGWWRGLLALGPDALTYLGRRDRGRLKAAAVARFLKGIPAETVRAEAEAYADSAFDALMRPDALACWGEWGKKGAVRVIVTASPTLTVRPFAQRLGADHLLGTELALDAHGRITGSFWGHNCRGDEKVLRLRETFGPQVRLAAAYGDTSGDTAMLSIAEEAGFRRFTGRP